MKFPKIDIKWSVTYNKSLLSLKYVYVYIRNLLLYRFIKIEVI